MAAAAEQLTKADFQSDQETALVPGLRRLRGARRRAGVLPELGIPPERIVFVSGIGCAGRFAYYMDTYGMHGIHGRGPALATGLAAARDDLSIWVVTGDGDALSIGGNHLIHALRRNVPVKILLFNNQIYGLTKGQSVADLGDRKSHEVDAVRLDRRTRSTRSRSRSAPRRRSSPARSTPTSSTCPPCCAPPPPTRARRSSRSTRTAPCSTTARSTRCATRNVARSTGSISSTASRSAASSARRTARCRSGARASRWCTTRAHDPSFAFALSRLSSSPDGPTPIGVFQDVQRPVSGRELTAELAAARAGASVLHWTP